MIKYIIDRMDEGEYIIPDSIDEIYIKNSKVKHLILSKNTRIIEGINNEIRKISISSALVVLILPNCGIEEIDSVNELTQDKVYIIDIKNNKLKDTKTISKLKYIYEYYK